MQLWKETDGVLPWIKKYIATHKLQPELINLSTNDSNLIMNSTNQINEDSKKRKEKMIEDSNESSPVSLSGIELHNMFVGMYNTAIEIILESI